VKYYKGWLFEEVLEDMHKRLQKLELEPKPAETWRDVSAECEWDGWACIFHKNGGPNGDLVVTPSNGYRFRKVCYGSNAFIHGDDVNHMHAFLIEKREGA
jgi:hypothetical protein